MKGTGNTAYEQRDSNSYGIIPLFLKKRLATNFSMFAIILLKFIISLCFLYYYNKYNIKI